MNESNECPTHGVFTGSYCATCHYEAYQSRQPVERNPFYETPSLAQIVSRLIFPAPKPIKRRRMEVL
jgi:hypothetical protein